jgi:DNA polymerase eta
LGCLKISHWPVSNGECLALCCQALWINPARQGLIAINYPARKLGLNRFVTIQEAKKLCPNLICQHVATWREGDTKWAYHDDAASHIATHKVSLDPYRLESRKILACIKSCLPHDQQKVEKASIDEVFLDLSAQVHTLLLERYPELAQKPPNDDYSLRLPPPPTTALDWKADALIDLDDGQTEDDDPDWDDLAMLIGSEIVRDVRAAVRAQLKYTCSAGVSHNKMLAKLGSAYKKPNQQTVIRNRAAQQFLSDMKFTKIRNLGGKFGDQVVASFNTDSVKELLEYPIEQLKKKVGDDAGTWLYQTIRGIDMSEVNPRTQIKSMLSAKSFRPSINTQEQAMRWVRIFVADIYTRLVEEGILENKRRPKTLTMHFRQGGQTRSRQLPIPQGRTLDEPTLLALAGKLLTQIVMEGNVWPCANLSLAVGGFEDGVSGNMGIGSFLVKGEAAKALETRSTGPSSEDGATQREAKRIKTAHEPKGIHRFLRPSESVDSDVASSLSNGAAEEGSTGDGNPSTPIESSDEHAAHAVICHRCGAAFESELEITSHEDWHFAKDLQDEERKAARPQSIERGPALVDRGKQTSKGRRGGTGAKSEKGQKKLSFG